MESIGGNMKKPTKLEVEMWTDDIKDHRYRSIDDWQDPVRHSNALEFRTQVADTGNIDYNFLVLMHAFVEQYLCYKHKITDEQVTTFDMDHSELDDPGEELSAPYHDEHMVANQIEAELSVALGVEWKAYETAIEKTLKKYKYKK